MQIEYEYEGKTCILNIKDYELNPMKQRFLKNIRFDNDAVRAITDILCDLDATKLCDGMQVTSTKYPKYENSLSLFQYYLLKIQDQNTYNIMIKMLIETHIKNLNFEKTYIDPRTNKAKRSAYKKKHPLWIRQESKDLFDGEPMYIYTNTRTNEVIKSHNPNLIEEELSVKKKKKSKENKIIGGKILFSFKIK